MAFKKTNAIPVKTDPAQHASEGQFIFPVYSRRIGGISVGINLFPEKKICNFDCPYCEVLPPKHPQKFSLPKLQTQLTEFFDEHPSLQAENIPIKSITFSGDGEPTLSPAFTQALDWVVAFVQQKKWQKHLNVVLITNATQLLNPQIQPALQKRAGTGELHIWAKCDAGTEGWYKKMNQSHVPFPTIQKNIATFSKTAPLILQTMVVALHHQHPDLGEYEIYCNHVRRWVEEGSHFTEIHFYTQARHPTYNYSEPVSDSFLIQVAQFVQANLGQGILVKAFGQKERLM